MSLSLQVYAIRDISSRLEPMLRVLEVCSTAGVSYPPEMINFFGDAWKHFGPDAGKLKEAMENVQLPIIGDVSSADGASISLENLPPGTFALRIQSTQEAQPVRSAAVPVATPLAKAVPIDTSLDEPAPLAYSPPVSFPAGVEIEEHLVNDDDEPLDLDEPTDIIPQSVAQPIEDDVVIEFPAESGPVSIIADQPLNIDLDDSVEEPDSPRVEKVRYQENRVIDLDQEDDLVLSVEDDLLDIDDLDDPLELDEPAEQL